MISASTVDLNRVLSRLNELQDAMGGDEAAQALMAGAFVLEGEVKNNIQRMRAIDTSFMFNSVYSTSKPENNFGDAQAAAKSCNPKAEMLPQVTLPTAQAAVCVGAEYANHVEYGTRRMAARPFLRQAAQTHGDDAVNAIAEAIERKMERIFR